jgi:hypothetical protein
VEQEVPYCQSQRCEPWHELGHEHARIKALKEAEIAEELTVVAVTGLSPDLPLNLTGPRKIVAPAGRSVGSLNAAAITALIKATMDARTSSDVDNPRASLQQLPDDTPAEDLL